MCVCCTLCALQAADLIRLDVIFFVISRYFFFSFPNRLLISGAAVLAQSLLKCHIRSVRSSPVSVFTL